MCYFKSLLLHVYMYVDILYAYVPEAAHPHVLYSTGKMYMCVVFGHRACICSYKITCCCHNYCELATGMYAQIIYLLVINFHS